MILLSNGLNKTICLYNSYLFVYLAVVHSLIGGEVIAFETKTPNYLSLALRKNWLRNTVSLEMKVEKMGSFPRASEVLRLVHRTGWRWGRIVSQDDSHQSYIHSLILYLVWNSIQPQNVTYVHIQVHATPSLHMLSLWTFKDRNGNSEEAALAKWRVYLIHSYSQVLWQAFAITIICFVVLDSTWSLILPKFRISREEY